MTLFSLFRADCGPDGVEECKVCHRHFPSVAAMQQHLRICVNSGRTLKVSVLRLTVADDEVLTCKAPGIDENQQCGEDRSQEHVDMHSTANPGEIKCAFNTCGLVFSSSRELQQHVDKVHYQALRISCGILCGASSAGETLQLKEHSHQHAPQEKVDASDAYPPKNRANVDSPLSKNEHRTYSLHRRTFSAELICSMCGKNFDRQIDFKLHVAMHNTETPGVLKCLHWKCQHQLFHNAEDLRKHSKEMHEGLKQIQCDQPFQCDICPLSYKTENYLKKHKSKMHAVCPFKCIYCGEGFEAKLSFDEHLEKHKTDTPGVLKCLQIGCEKTFKFPKELTLHTLQHLAVCDIPDCLFISKSEEDLYLHKSFFHCIWSLRCHLCNRGFYTKSIFQLHFNEHKTEKDGVFKCVLAGCGATSSDLLQLRMHINQHKRIYECDVPDCVFACMRLCELQLHKKNAHSIWLYKCQLCGKGFDRAPEHAQHVKDHARFDISVINCFFSGCKQTFASLADLKKHAAEKHFDLQCSFIACDVPD
jgi:KRAB domain-containing zinc finger protein